MKSYVIFVNEKIIIFYQFGKYGVRSRPTDKRYDYFWGSFNYWNDLEKHIGSKKLLG